MRRDPGPSLARMSPIGTSRLRLRVLEASDAALFRAMTDEPSIIDKVHFLSHPFTITQARQLILGREDGRDAFWGVWAPEQSAMLGTVGSHLRVSDTRDPDTIEIGYWFASTSQGRGYATEAVGAVVQALATSFPQCEVYAECRPENAPSWRLLQRLGFRSSGRDGSRTGRKRLVWRRGLSR